MATAAGVEITFDVIRKVMPTAVKAIEGKDRVLEFGGTTETQDRDGEVIKASAWQTERYVKNPVVQWAHDYTAPPIGKTVSITRRGADTVFQIEFADAETYPFADTIFRLCKGGFLSATSVGFIPIESKAGKKESDPRRTYTKVELLEISIVPVPSNPEALVTARDAGVITVKEYRVVRGLAQDIASAPIIDMTDEHHPKEISQAQIKDDIDYLAECIRAVGLSPENQATLRRIAGSDMPVTDIKAATIRDMVNTVCKTLKAHHDAHNKAYDRCLKAMGEMPEALGEDSDVTEKPEEEEEEEDKKKREYMQSEIQRQISEAFNNG
jgi:HK97 family phage prohead protease